MRKQVSIMTAVLAIFMFTGCCWKNGPTYNEITIYNGNADMEFIEHTMPIMKQVINDSQLHEDSKKVRIKTLEVFIKTNAKLHEAIRNQKYCKTDKHLYSPGAIAYARFTYDFYKLQETRMRTMFIDSTMDLEILNKHLKVLYDRRYDSMQMYYETIGNLDKIEKPAFVPLMRE